MKVVLFCGGQGTRIRGVSETLPKPMIPIGEVPIPWHIRNPEIVIKEMLRVSRKGIFISDSNAFGQGSLVVRIIKQTINYLKLWPLANYFKTFGHGYIITEGDGLSYSHSVFNNYDQIRKGCKAVHLINTSVGGINPYKTAGSVALLGIKK